MTILIKKDKFKNEKLELYFEQDAIEGEVFSVCLNYCIQENGEHEFYSEDYSKLSDALTAYDKIRNLLEERENNESKTKD